MITAPLHLWSRAAVWLRVPVRWRRCRSALATGAIAGNGCQDHRDEHGWWRNTLGAAAIAGIFAGCAAVDPVASGGVGIQPDGASESVLPARTPSADALYNLLVGELASHRGDLGLALEKYLEVARETRDAQVAARAARLATFAHDDERALEAARLWAEGEPASVEARQVLASLLVRNGDTGGAIEHLTAVVEALSEPPGEGFHRVADLLSAEKHREAASAVMKQLVLEHEGNAAAHLALARFLARIGSFEEASAASDRAYELDPGSARTAVFRARMRQREDGIEGAFSVLAEFLQRSPDSGTVRMTYARMLVDAERYEKARAELEYLVAAEAGNDDARFALALLLLRTDQLDDAVQHFERLSRRDSQRNAAHYYLARIAESRGRIGDAIASYRRVRRGEHRLSAQIRVAVLYAESGDVEAARRHLHGVRSESTREAVRLRSAEAGLLARAARYDEAMSVYDAALDMFPGHTDLLYGRGMLAEKMDRLDILERDMRAIIEREPDNADALNALGYTFADRTDRYAEAYALIKRAIELRPDDHYIIDSLGWVLHRMGRHQEALVHLRRAMSIEPDPEIAAHLGEVLWVLGSKVEARAVWSDALEAAPGDERLLDMIERFGP